MNIRHKIDPKGGLFSLPQGNNPILWDTSFVTAMRGKPSKEVAKEFSRGAVVYNISSLCVEDHYVCAGSKAKVTGVGGFSLRNLLKLDVLDFCSGGGWIDVQWEGDTESYRYDPRHFAPERKPTLEV